MALYEYRASTIKGKSVKGKEQAADPVQLRQQLKEKGFFLLSCKEAEEKASTKPLKAKQLTEFCRELGAMIGAGVPLIRAFNIMSQRDVAPKMKKIYASIHADLQNGLMLSEALTNQHGIFPALLINMYKASEATGSMDLTSRKMADHYDKQHKLNQKVKGATMYPIILLVVTVIVLVIVFLVVLPKFFEMFNDLNAPMPAITKFMLGLSANMKDHWLTILIVVLVIVLAFRTALKMPQFRLKFDHFKLKMPVVGKLMKIVFTARFAGTLSTSYASGISMINALNNTRDTVGNTYISSQFEEMIADIRNGEQLSTAIGKIDGFDKKLAASVMIGEETGQLEQMLTDTSTAFDYEAEIALQKMMSILGPALIVFMAVIIGTVIISVVLPLPNMYNAIGGGA